MKRYLFVPVAILLILGLLLAGCASQPSAPTTSAPTTAAHAPVNVNLLGAQLGSDAHNFAQASGDIINKNHPWLRVSVVETQGGTENIKTMVDLDATKKLTYIGNANDEQWSALARDMAPFKGIGTQDWRVLATLYSTATGFMTLNPNIKTYKDMIGKKVGYPPKGHGMIKNLDSMVISAWEISDKITIVNMPLDMLKDALLDGTVDVIASGGMYISETAYKVSPYNEQVLAARDKVYFIGITKEELEHAKAKDPDSSLSWQPVKANSLKPGYPQIDSGVQSCGMTWVAWKDMPDETAYEFVKTLGNNVNKYVEYFAAGKGVVLENFVKANPWKAAQYHPGALKYYTEKGLTPKGVLPR